MTSLGLRLSQIITRYPTKCHTAFVNQVRHSGYYSSPFLADLGEVNTKYEVTQSPEDWKYVERLLPPTVVPEPPKKAEYPSGWKPQGDDFGDRPYFVQRTRNHMMPVYLKSMRRNTVRLTVIKHIQGDIWKLEQDLRPFLTDLVKPKPLRLQVDEYSAKIVMNGDYVNAIKYWLGERNF